MQEESGRDLQRFFERWIYNAALPQITFSSRVESGASGQVAVLRFEQTTPEIFDLPATVTLLYADGRTKDVTVVINDRIVEVHEAVDGALRSVSISKRDVALVDFKDVPSPGR
jgi:aminopeptidase N